jgi:hypothetical protein
MSRTRVLQILNVVALVATLIMNFVAQSDLVPNTVGALGESRAIFFLPAGYVFAIWGVIYIGLIGFAIYQARPVAVEKGIVDRVGIWFIVSNIANSVWVILFVYNYIWISTAVIVVLLFSLIMIYRNLGIGVREVDWQEQWAAHIPFSIYLGWVSVATVANLSAALYESGYELSFLGINADLWAAIMMAVAAVLAFVMLYFRRDLAYALVVIWAVVGIYARPFDTEVFELLSGLNASLVNTAALVVAAVVAIGVAGSAFLQLQRRS